YASNWVFGVEGDVDFMNLKRSRSFSFHARGEDTVGALTAKLQWLTSVRARLGYAWDRTLLYATGGLAAGGVKSSVSASWDNGQGVFLGSNSDTRIGWILGVGAAYAFTKELSGKLEYLHFDLGNTSYPVVLVSGSSGLPSTWTANSRVSGDIVRVGINLKLNP